MPREWDAVAYDALPLPHVRWGRNTLARLKLTGSETVLDAGCGTGRDAQRLLEHLPHGRVIAVDGSLQMLEQLRARLGPDLERVEVIHADLEKPLPIADPVDAVLSVAAFHWIKDHDALFSNLAAVLRPGGRLATECGGQGNIADVAEAIDDVLGRPPQPWEFAGIEDTRRRLQNAGFVEVDVRLVPDAVRLSEAEQFRAYLRIVMVGAELDLLPPAEHDAFIEAIAARLPEPVIDYVRLEIDAIRDPNAELTAHAADTGSGRP
jgi:trans-aconitate 2-methyltransferase